MVHQGNSFAILDQRIYDSTIQEVISDRYKFKKLNEDPTLKREAFLQCFSCKLK